MLDLGAFQGYAQLTTPDMPPQAWWVLAVVLAILGAAAVFDAFKAIVPEPLIFAGLVIVVAGQGLYVDWPFAAGNLALGLAAAILIWAVNWLWHRAFKHDAIGMGDAKWTILAVTAFGLLATAYAWGLGAILAICWMGILRLAKRNIARVHFAPFLFIGLVAAIYFLRMR
jgi:prepilin signal peptidase PulO-like enzyme (type II secretory pathway)